MSARARYVNDGARIIAATLGTLPVALLAAALIARFAPMSADARFALAYALVVPLWLLAMCVTFLVRRGLVALGACVALTLVLGCLLRFAA